MGTVRMNLPFIEAGQVQKEIQLNEALQLIDLLLHPCIDGFGQSSPPENPALGTTYVTGTQPLGDWTGYPLHLAVATEGGWRLTPPVEGLCATMKADGQPVRFVHGAWRVGALQAGSIEIGGKQVLGPRRAAIEAPSGGVNVDGESRRAIEEVLQALREHGLIEV